MTSIQADLITRPLTSEDFEQVVNIDAAISGRRRPGFFEKRVAAALREPKYFVYIGCEVHGKLKGYLLARLLEGEYGGTAPVAVLDSIGVDPDAQGQGCGRALLQEMENILQHKQVGRVHTRADWRNRTILRFFADVGFRLTTAQILERDVSRPLFLPDVEAEQETEYADSEEHDYSVSPNRDEFGLARNRLICRVLEQQDAPSLVRIDRKITGQKRDHFYQRKIREMLDETGIRVSLVAELEGNIIGFIMARVDYGEFDRTEPKAVLDNIGVDPAFSHHQVGRSLLAQLLKNLLALRIEKINTEIDMDHIDILAFLLQNGFRQTQELAFSYTLN